MGLGGSSAIVIATLRALCELHEAELGPADLARIALAIEVEGLDIAAGLQDRVAQSFGGLTFMDFASGTRGHGAYETLESSLLPPLLIAYRSESGSDSGDVHADLRARYERGEPLVRDGMVECARDAGACANYTGSGGAIVCVCRDEHHRDAVSAALLALRCMTVVGR